MRNKKPVINHSIDHNIFYTGKPKWFTVLMDVLIVAMCLVVAGLASVAMATALIKFTFGGLI